MSYLTISCYAGNYRTRTDTKRNADKPKAFARGIFGGRGAKATAERHAEALATHYGNDANVMFFALPYEVAVRRYTLST